MTSPGRGGQEAVDSLDMTGHFGFCTFVEVNVITKCSSILKSRSFGFCQIEMIGKMIRGDCLVNDFARSWRTGSC